VQQQDRFHYQGFTGAFSSFFVSGDPNSIKLTAADVSGVPSLASGREFVIASDGFSMAPITQLKQRCDFWKEKAAKVPI